jgi:hypothetical protein
MPGKTPVDMPPGQPKPEIIRPTPKTVPIKWDHPAPKGPKPQPTNTPKTK